MLRLVFSTVMAIVISMTVIDVLKTVLQGNNPIVTALAK